jgi:hypothetical protein
MDEWNEAEHGHMGMDPRMRRHLKKVLNSLFVGLFWLIAVMFFGIFLDAAFPIGGHVDAVNVAFYVFFVGSLAWIIRFYYRTWKS